jgi:hypothetical protein
MMKLNYRLALLTEFAVICMLISLLLHHNPTWDRYAAALFGASIGLIIGVVYESTYRSQ